MLLRVSLHTTRSQALQALVPRRSEVRADKRAMRRLATVAAALTLVGGVVGCGSSKHTMSTVGTPVRTGEASSTQEALNQVAKETQTADQEMNKGAERLRRERENREEGERRQQEQPHELGSACKGADAGSSACIEEVKQCEATPSCSSELAKGEEHRARDKEVSEAEARCGLNEGYEERSDGRRVPCKR